MYRVFLQGFLGGMFSYEVHAPDPDAACTYVTNRLDMRKYMIVLIQYELPEAYDQESHIW